MEQQNESTFFVETLEDRILLSAAGLEADAGASLASNAGSAWAGNRIWNDVNGNGSQQSGESEIADVEVVLFEEGNPSAVDSTTTGATPKLQRRMEVEHANCGAEK